MQLKIFLNSLSTRFLIIGLLFGLIFSPQLVFAEKKIQPLGSLKLLMPKDIHIEIFANDLNQARHMAFDDQGVLFLSQAREGKVVALPDVDNNGNLQIK